jgi:hypothetical protein
MGWHAIFFIFFSRKDMYEKDDAGASGRLIGSMLIKSDLKEKQNNSKLV